MLTIRLSNDFPESVMADRFMSVMHLPVDGVFNCIAVFAAAGDDHRWRARHVDTATVAQGSLSAVGNLQRASSSGSYRTIRRSGLVSGIGAATEWPW